MKETIERPAIVQEDWQPIKAPEGMFFCEACLKDLPLEERSPKDMRYCAFCQPIIENEYLMLASHKGRSLSQFYCPITLSPLPGQGDRNMSTLEESKITVDIIPPRVGKRGPKKMELPEGRIREMAGAGMGSRAIAGRLKAESSITISYKTIQRLLEGQR